MRQTRTYLNNVAARITSPVTAAPVTATPMTTAPAPMPAAPIATMPATAPAPMTAPVAAMPAPAHLFRLQMFRLVPGGDSGTGILVRRRQRSVLCERMRHKRCCPCACGQRAGARGKSKGEFQKIAAFHGHLPLRASDAKRFSPRADERSLNRGTLLLSLYRRPRESGVVIRGARVSANPESRATSAPDSGFIAARCPGMTRALTPRQIPPPARESRACA